MHPVFASAYRRLSDEIATLDATSAHVHPWGRPQCWSIQQIVEHLILALDQTRTALEERLAKGRPDRSCSRNRTRTEWMMQLMVLSAGHMPKGVGAPPETTPPDRLNSASVRELVERIGESIEALDAVLEETRQRFGMERVSRHFLLGPLRVDQLRRYHVLHLLHHTRQVAEVRNGLMVEVVQARHMARV